MTVTYLVALVLLGALAAITYRLLTARISTGHGRAALLNRTARHRWLIKQASFDALKVMAASEPDERARSLSALRGSTEDLERHAETLAREYAVLRGGVRSGGAEGQGALLAEVAQYARYLRAVATDDAALSSRGIDAVLAGILSHERALISSLERLVAEHARESDSSVGRLQTLAGWSLGGTLTLLVLVGLFLFRPLVGRLRRESAMVAEAEEKMRQLAVEYGRLERLAVTGELAAFAVHEIRTPLNALAINTQQILRLGRRNQPGDQEKARALTETLLVEVERLNKMVEEHLLTRRPAKLDRVEPVLANAVLVEGLHMIQHELEAHGVIVREELDPQLPTVDTDPLLLRQVLLNILVNAVQAMPDGGELVVHTSATGREVAVRITDSGPGIPSEDHERIFKPFVTTKPQGTGLGLAVCARIVNEMRGAITVESAPGRGATFVVRLPRRV
ncbi:MAG: hypothetical protein IT371_22210 [Deltaproteobacteria bacterium]|nr:hypothetical protein [Deltaproteobacteria bacterium]